MQEKKNKSTKRFNMIDFAILVIVLLLVAGAVWQIISAQSDANSTAGGDAEETLALYEAYPRMRFTVVCPNVPNDAAAFMLRTEDTQLNNNYKDLPAFILDVEAAAATSTVTNADGTVSQLEDADTSTVTFTIEAHFDREEAEEEQAYKLGTQELRIGKGYIVKTKSMETSGYVTAMEVVDE